MFFQNLTFLFLLLTFVSAQKLPHIKPPALNNQETYPEDLSISSTIVKDRTVRVAIIGAGAAGSSVAYHLQKLINDTPTHNRRSLNITVLEGSKRIGGRAYAVQIPVGDKFITQEMGASIIAEANTYLLNATMELGLTKVSAEWNELIPDNTDPESLDLGVGIWDGEKFRFTLPPNSNWMKRWSSNLALLRRYGIFNGPLKAVSLCTEPVKKFLSLYDRLEKGESFASIASIINVTQLWDTIEKTGYCFFKNDHSINKAFVREFLGGIVRVTYSQNVESITSMGSLMSLYSSTAPLFKIKGGNQLLFEKMLRFSEASIVFDARVAEIEKKINKDNSNLYQVKTAGGEVMEYDVVIVATPLNGNIKLTNISAEVERMKYVELVVTVIVGELNPGYFKLSDATKIPGTILIPSEPDLSMSDIPFHSGKIVHSSRVNETLIQVVKFYSIKEMDETVLNNLFVRRDFIERVTWNQPGAYPYLSVRRKGEYVGDVQIDDGLYYANVMEGFMSSMETESVIARNIATLVKDNFF